MNVKITYVNPENVSKTIEEALYIEQSHPIEVETHIVCNRQMTEKAKTETEQERSYEIVKAYETLSRFIREKLDPHCAILVTANDATVIRKDSHFVLEPTDACPDA